MLKEDVRIIKTKQSIENALMELLKKKTWDKISIKNICEQAMISRSTFYSHFADKYDLLSHLISGENLSFSRVSDSKDVREKIRDRLLRIKEAEVVLNNLFNGRPEEEIVSMLSNQFRDMAENVLAEHGVKDYISEEGLNIAIGFYAAGLSYTVALWIMQMPTVTVDEMTENLYWLIAPQIAMLDYMRDHKKAGSAEAFEEWMQRK